jgi:hypothetical protein
MGTRIVFALLVLLATAYSDGVRLDRPLPVDRSVPSLQYDDGSAYWLTWVGLYKGVWFNVTDFDPEGGTGMITDLEYWFYHHSSYPWDTASFYGELYSGDEAGPVTEINQTSITALHYAPCYASYLPWGICVEENFWGIIDSEMSSGGWPSILGDNTPQYVSHSFQSDDFSTWEPWIVGSGSTARDYFIRANGAFGGIGLAEGTWGSIKGLFGR